jgi:uncharacterized protein with NRDE domain
MCTVTYIPCKDHFFLTSNRDEKKGRRLAEPPDIYSFPNGRVVYPKDTDAGGTWMALHENGNAIVLLNGAFVKHEVQPPYRHSRGLVVLKLIQQDFPFTAFKEINLSNIEPFTLVIREVNKLVECRWDGETRFFKELDKSEAHIWSSVTLYDGEVVNKRNQWFAEWLQAQAGISLESVLSFHQFTGDGDQHNDLLMNRNNELFTVSITSFSVAEAAALIHYSDLQKKQTFQQQITLQKSTVS